MYVSQCCLTLQGVNVSKVRSLHFDQWHLSLVQLMYKIGNKRLNNILEVCCLEGTKPAPDSKRTSREAFIQCKYVSKDFMRQPLDPSPGMEGRKGFVYVRRYLPWV